MNDLSLSVSSRGERISSEPIPRLAIFILIPLFLLGFGVSIFILAVVHNVVFFLCFLSLSSIVVAFVVWNKRNAPLLLFLRSTADSDLRLARQGQIVKVTGAISCGNVPLESSYEKVGRCVYTSTLFYEYQEFGFKTLKLNSWRLSYSEMVVGLTDVYKGVGTLIRQSNQLLLFYLARSMLTLEKADLAKQIDTSSLATAIGAQRFSTDFYICDRKSGIRTLVKAGRGCKLIPLIIESRLVNSKGNNFLSPNLIKWLTDRNLSAEPRFIRLEEGYIKEGDYVSVVGMLCRDEDDIGNVVQPPEIVETGCQWQTLLLPVHFDGLLLGTP